MKLVTQTSSCLMRLFLVPLALSLCLSSRAETPPPPPKANVAVHDFALLDHQAGFENAEIKAAHNRAKASQSYDKVERWFGNGRPNTFEKAYAMTSPQEYFAESTEAFFSRNDFFPFTRAELEKHDLEMFELLKKLSLRS